MSRAFEVTSIPRVIKEPPAQLSPFLFPRGSHRLRLPHLKQESEHKESDPASSTCVPEDTRRTDPS